MLNQRADNKDSWYLDISVSLRNDNREKLWFLEMIDEVGV